MQKKMNTHRTRRRARNQQPPSTGFTTRIGSTFYTVTLFNSQKSKDTIEDKLIRLIESVVRESA